MIDEELKLMARNYIERDGTTAEKIFDSIKLSLTKKRSCDFISLSATVLYRRCKRERCCLA